LSLLQLCSVKVLSIIPYVTVLKLMHDYKLNSCVIICTSNFVSASSNLFLQSVNIYLLGLIYLDLGLVLMVRNRRRIKIL